MRIECNKHKEKCPNMPASKRTIIYNPLKLELHIKTETCLDVWTMVSANSISLTFLNLSFCATNWIADLVSNDAYIGTPRYILTFHSISMRKNKNASR